MRGMIHKPPMKGGEPTMRKGSYSEELVDEHIAPCDCGWTDGRNQGSTNVLLRSKAGTRKRRYGYFTFSFWVSRATLAHLSRKSEILLKSSVAQPRVVIAGARMRTPPGESTRNRLTIQRNGRNLTHLLLLGPRQTVWTKIPKHQVSVSAATGELVRLGNQTLCQGACIGHNGFGVFHKFRCVHPQKLRSQGPIWWL